MNETLEEFWPDIFQNLILVEHAVSSKPPVIHFHDKIIDLPPFKVEYTMVDQAFSGFDVELMRQRDQVQSNEMANQFMTFYKIGQFLFICYLHD